jgi:hypothetical protein
MIRWLRPGETLQGKYVFEACRGGPAPEVVFSCCTTRPPQLGHHWVQLIDGRAKLFVL